MSPATAPSTRPTARAQRPATGPNRRNAARPAPAPRLRVVAAPQRPGFSLVAVCSALLAVGLVCLLLLTVSLSRGAYRMRELRARSIELTEQRQALAEQVAEQQAPGALAARAGALGMVPAPDAAMLRVGDGQVVGHASEASRATVPTTATAPSAPRPTAGTGPAGAAARGAVPSVPAKAGTAKAGTEKTGTAKAGTEKTGTAKAGTSKAGTANPTRTGPVPSPSR